MKDLIDTIKKELYKKNSGLHVTGKKFMEIFNITFNDIEQFEKNSNVHMYRGFCINCSSKYAAEVINMFDQIDYIAWEQNGIEKYITRDGKIAYSIDESEIGKTADIMELMKSTDEIYVYVEYSLKDFVSYNKSLEEYVVMLPSLKEHMDLFCEKFEERTSISLDCGHPDFDADYIIKNHEIIEKKMSYADLYFEEEKNGFIYSLIFFSYDVPLSETLKMLNLY